MPELMHQNRLSSLLTRFRRAAHLHPLRLGILVALIIMGLSLIFGRLLGLQAEPMVDWLDKAFTVLGGLSLAFGWAIWLVERARRDEAARTFRRAGSEIPDMAFDAALILASRNQALLEWHMLRMAYQRVELVWTDHTREAALGVLRLCENVRNLHGPGTSNEEPLPDAFDLKQIKDHCRGLLAELLARYPRHRVCVDVTGGTAVMSVGAFQVAEELGVTSVYLLGVHRSANGQPEIRREHVHDALEGRILILSDHRRDPRPTAAT